MKQKVTKIADIPKKVKEKGIRMDFFLKTIGMSRSHFHFVRKGDRVLSDEYKQKINELLEITLP